MLVPGGTVILFVSPYLAYLWVVELEKAGLVNQAPSKIYAMMLS